MCFSRKPIKKNEERKEPSIETSFPGADRGR
jgi:hypothetical protein